MEKDLLKFNEKLDVKREGQVVSYGDDKGNYFIVALAPKYQHIAQLLLNCEYIEADEIQMKTLLYNGDIEKGIEFDTATVSRPVSKYEITKKESDKATIVDRDVKVSKVWVVKNGFKLTKSFNKMADAIECCKNENDKLFDIVK